jgi:hypothetical protein
MKKKGREREGKDKIKAHKELWRKEELGKLLTSQRGDTRWPQHIQRGEMMGPWLLSSEEWLSRVCCFLLKLWLVSDDENFHLLKLWKWWTMFIKMNMHYEVELKKWLDVMWASWLITSQLYTMVAGALLVDKQHQGSSGCSSSAALASFSFVQCHTCKYALIYVHHIADTYLNKYVHIISPSEQVYINT